MKSNIEIELCFVGSLNEGLHIKVDQALELMFKDALTWRTETEEEHDKEVITAVIQGLGCWQSEDDLFAYIEKNADASIWSKVVGFRVQVNPDPNGEGCGCD